MKKDLPRIVAELCEFTGHHLSKEKQEALIKHVSIENMRKIGAEHEFAPGEAAKFFRKGVVGDWKNYFEGEHLKEWDEWIQANLDGTDIDMPFKP